MARHIFYILIILLPQLCPGQVFLNGSFELTSSDKDTLNIKNEVYNLLMPYSTSFGTNGNMDIVKTNTFCGPAQDGDWYVAMTGGGTDMISLTLSEPLKAGVSYSISFYDRQCHDVAITSYSIQLGLSTVKDSFGTALFTSANPPDTVWSARQFSFVAPYAAAYITIRLTGGGSFGTWTQIDNFNMSCIVLFDLGNDTIICENDPLQLAVQLANTTNLWQDGSTGSIFNVTSEGKYWVEVNNGNCIGYDTIAVSYKKCTGAYFIPNAFTPNGDGMNDIFRVNGFVQNFRMQIYDRWGRLLFTSANPGLGWNGNTDGKPAPAGVYVYYLRYTTASGSEEITRGTVALVR